jgi:hypothetical protein
LTFSFDGTDYNLIVVPYIENVEDLIVFNKSYDAFKTAFTSFENRIKNERIRIASLDRNPYASTTSGKLVQTFQVNNFGLWNVDKPIRKELPVQVNAKFQDEAGNEILVDNGYLVLRNRNSILFVQTFYNFSFNPASRDNYWAVLKDDKVGIVYPDQFDRFKKGKSIKAVYVMKVYDGIENAQYVLKKAIGI